jgi:phenylacetate-CoA ligase
VLHIIESAYFPEVLDIGSLLPVDPGREGELVLTTLGRLGSPLIRYRTGDIVRRAETIQCECGSRELALDGGILGRTDDMLVVRGVNIFPTAVEEILRSFPSVAEFQVEVFTERALPEMSVQIEPAPGDHHPSQLDRRVAAALQNAFGLRVSVSSVPCGALPRFEGKAKRWIRR